MPRYRFAIKEQFQAKGYRTAYAVARALNKKDSQAGRIMDNERDRIAIATINELCEFLDCSPGDLFAPIDEKPAEAAKTKKKR